MLEINDWCHFRCLGKLCRIKLQIRYFPDRDPFIKFGTYIRCYKLISILDFCIFADIYNFQISIFHRIQTSIYDTRIICL